jgi:hypothetical protein
MQFKDNKETEAKKDLKKDIDGRSHSCFSNRVGLYLSWCPTTEFIIQRQEENLN